MVHFSWKISHKDNPMRRLEDYTILLFSLLLFFVMLLHLQREVFPAIIYVLTFWSIYLMVRFVIEKYFHFEEHYEIIGNHLHIAHKRKGKLEKQKIHLKSVKKSSFDHHLLGGYIVTKKKRHSLAFNSEKEMKEVKKKLRC